MLSRRSLFFLGAGAAAVGAGGVSARAFAAEMKRARARIAAGSLTIETQFGTMEYARAGSGPPLLMVHGSGGGFDQGLSFARRLIEAGREVIAPSRFGYLRSDFPADPSAANQADAFALLLDALEIERLPVVGGSAGALSAIEFAIRHPDRCAALVAIVPAAYAPDRPSFSPMSPAREKAMRVMLGSDFLFWTAMNLVRDQMYSAVLATDPALVAAAAPDERARAERILREILPVSRRARGLVNDAALTLDPAPQALERVAAPTLAISLEDDRFGTFDAARHIAGLVRGARLLSWPSGGHIWIGHDADLFGEIDAFLSETA